MCFLLLCVCFLPVGTAPDLSLAGGECVWQPGWCHRWLEPAIPSFTEQRVQHCYGLPKSQVASYQLSGISWKPAEVFNLLIRFKIFSKFGRRRNSSYEVRRVEVLCFYDLFFAPLKSTSSIFFRSHIALPFLIFLFSRMSCTRCIFKILKYFLFLSFFPVVQ